MNDKPFTFGIATSGDNFTDRTEETERLLLNFRHGINTVLISPRRIGKTSLVRKVCDMARSEKLKVVYLDIFSCRNDNEFYNAFASAVLKQTSSKPYEWLDDIKSFLSRITPSISFSPDPSSKFSISLELNPKDDDIEDILQLPEKIAQKKGCDIVICIDEFQQIAEFDDSKTFQKRLRAVWQLQKSVSYCLFGSKQHLMNELFEKRSLPFYKFGDTIYLPKISTPDWIEYICGRFKATGKRISEELARRICTVVDNHSSYVQQLAWLVWVHTDHNATEQDLDEACRDILDQNTPLFEKQTESLTTYQMNFLRAVLDGVN
ncbi:MAG: ATP-binding protein, partial [Rikenellaceae bacterium]|nr:ATP-binding protein [Rikenellaceae bacterium]